MFFLRTMSQPVVVTWGETDETAKTLTVPKFTMADAVELGNKIQQDRDAAATADMEIAAKREFQAFYPSIPPDLNEIKKYIRSVSGATFVVRTCLSRAKVKGPDGSGLPDLVTADVDSIIQANGAGRLVDMAQYLSDLYDTFQNPTIPAPPKPGPAAPITTSTETASSTPNVTDSQPLPVTGLPI